jgi:hypothetical protein
VKSIESTAIVLFVKNKAENNTTIILDEKNQITIKNIEKNIKNILTNIVITIITLKKNYIECGKEIDYKLIRLLELKNL